MVRNGGSTITTAMAILASTREGAGVENAENRRKRSPVYYSAYYATLDGLGPSPNVSRGLKLLPGAILARAVVV